MTETFLNPIYLGIAIATFAFAAGKTAFEERVFLRIISALSFVINLLLLFSFIVEQTS